MDKQDWVLVPLELPCEIAGAAACAGVFENGNPKRGWDFLLRLIGVRAHPLHPAAIDAEALINRLISADPTHEDCAAAAVLLRQLTSQHKGSELESDNAALRARIAEAEAQEAVGWVRPWDGDDSDLCNIEFETNEDAIKNQPGWLPVYAAPVPAAALPWRPISECPDDFTKVWAFGMIIGFPVLRRVDAWIARADGRMSRWMLAADFPLPNLER